MPLLNHKNKPRVLREEVRYIFIFSFLPCIDIFRWHSANWWNHIGVVNTKNGLHFHLFGGGVETTPLHPLARLPQGHAGCQYRKIYQCLFHFLYFGWEISQLYQSRIHSAFWSLEVEHSSYQTFDPDPLKIRDLRTDLPPVRLLLLLLFQYVLFVAVLTQCW